MDSIVYYTYLWLREDGTPYYVGKGTWERAHHWHERIGSAPPKDRILLEPHTTEEQAFEAEKFLIHYYGRKDNGTGGLSNMTDGGTQPPSRKGKKHTVETREKIQRALLGHGCSAKTRTLIGEKSKGRKQPHNKGATGFKQTPGMRAKRLETIAARKVCL